MLLPYLQQEAERPERLFVDPQLERQWLFLSPLILTLDLLNSFNNYCLKQEICHGNQPRQIQAKSQDCSVNYF